MAKTVKTAMPVKPEATPKKTEDQKQSSDTVSQQLKTLEEKNNKVQLAEDRRLYKRFKSQIDKAYAKMETSYLETAFALHAIYKHKLYTLDNFKNIYDFAKENYNIARGTCNNFINICEKFGVTNENGSVMELSDKYKGYGISQLAVMLAFPKDLLDKCSPDCSVRDLKKMRQEYETGSSVLVKSPASISDSNAEVHTGESKKPEIPEKSEDSETTGFSDAQSKPDKLDISVTQDSVLLCKANVFEQLLDLQEIIKDAYSDIIEANENKKVYLELSVRIE